MFFVHRHSFLFFLFFLDTVILKSRMLMFESTCAGTELFDPLVNSFPNAIVKMTSLALDTVIGAYRLLLQPIAPFTWFGIGFSTFDIAAGLRLCVVLRQLREMSLRHHLRTKLSRRADGDKKQTDDVEPLSYTKCIAVTLAVVFGGEAIMSPWLGIPPSFVFTPVVLGLYTGLTVLVELLPSVPVLSFKTEFPLSLFDGMTRAFLVCQLIPPMVTTHPQPSIASSPWTLILTSLVTANTGFFLINLFSMLNPTGWSLVTPAELRPYGWTTVDLWCAPLTTGLYALLTHAQPFWAELHGVLVQIFGADLDDAEKLSTLSRGEALDAETARAPSSSSLPTTTHPAMSDSEDAYYNSDDADDFTDFDDDDDEIVFSSAKDKGKEVDLSISFKSLSPEELRAEIDREIEGITSVLGVDRDLVLIFLMHYRWNCDKLIERYFESPSLVLLDVGDSTGNEETTVTEPGISSDPPKKRQRRAVSPTLPDSVCGVCFDEVPDPSEIPPMKCKHAFCRDCWSAYLASCIKSEGQCLIRCMGDKCKNSVSESFVKTFAEGEDYERWRVLVSQSYVSSTASLKYCPAPSCTETVQCLMDPSDFLLTVPTVTCSSGHSFCFGCRLDEGHAPVICKVAEQWLSSKDSGTTEWLTAHTRKCPKCTNNIEKSGGCNRMVCRQCRFQFCWVCLRDWSAHGYNQNVCHSYKEPEPTAEMDKAKAYLERWMFYYDRFNNHEVSAKLDQEVAERLEAKMEKLQKKSILSWIETHFMRHAVDELTKCRRSLKWTYAMAHFLKSGNKKEMFEDIQADLEKAVEELSQLVDEPIEDICAAGASTTSIKDLRLKIMDKTAYVKKRHEVLLTDIGKGMADNYWDWTASLVYLKNGEPAYFIHKLLA
ncbi:hypothetical protein ACEPAF_5272 [Sanghuangporus sanghuang]